MAHAATIALAIPVMAVAAIIALVVWIGRR